MSRKIKEDEYGVARVNGDNGFSAWSQGTNQKEWRMVDDVNYTLAVINIETERVRRDDWTGKRKYKIITTHRFFITLRIGRDQIELKDDWFENSSVKNQLIELMERFDLLYDMAWCQLKRELSDAVPEFKIMDLRYGNYTNYERVCKLMQIKKNLQ
jgi:hypothetical protein